MAPDNAGPAPAHQEVIEVDGDKVGCDGGEGALGHPLVYLELGAAGRIECPYCSRLYIRRAGTGGAGH